MSYFQETVNGNFIEVCERIGMTFEQALDWDYADADPSNDDLRDLAFGIGYVRGLADAWDMTALQVVEELRYEDD